MSVVTDKRGILLTEFVDFNWIKDIEPRFEDDFAKFVVNIRTNEVWIGMSIHANCVPFSETTDDYYGGNIFFNTGEIVYESTLNIEKNLALPGFRGNPRIIQDKETIALINSILFYWVDATDLWFEEF